MAMIPAALWALPALAAEYEDDYEGGSLITGIFFTIAVALLAVITFGIIYLSLREFMDRREEADAREEDDRAERVAEANKWQTKKEKKEKKKKLTPSQQVSTLPNRRERRRLEREGGGVSSAEEEE